jgi:AmmeMemoRadiSam system protein A
LVPSHDRRKLLALARRALEARVRREPPPKAEGGGALDRPLGAFVSIHTAGELRGCLGRLSPGAPLVETILHLAAAVSDSDPRFEPVVPAELSRLEIEISILTEEREVSSVEEIEVGRHGLIVESGRRRGLLLPQVAIEHGWDRMTFVEHVCLKAGLHREAWQDGATLAVFEAEVFGDPSTV